MGDDDMLFPVRRPSDFDDREAFLDQVVADYFDAVDAGCPPPANHLLDLYADYTEELLAVLDLDRKIGEQFESVSFTSPIPLGEFGEYELLELIGRGGMGAVFKARHRKLDRIVALKTIVAGRMAMPEASKRFERETKAVAKLDHPNVVPIYEVGHVDGIRFFTMKLVEGGDLSGKAMDPRAAARLIETCARAVQEAHQRGIVHRDLKPSNILVGEADHPYITDFGLAWAAEESDSITATGAIVGTLSYLSPEVAAQDTTRPTPAMDIYALGAVFYELLIGRPPFQAESTQDMLSLIQRKEPPAFSSAGRSIPSDLETIILKCLDKDPLKRYSSAADLADDLSRFLSHQPIAARRTKLLERSLRWCARNPAPTAIASLLLLLALVSISAASVWLEQRDAARNGLWEARVFQARYGRAASEPGRRIEGLKALREAASIRPETDLRDHVIACLGLDDFELARAWESSPHRTTSGLDPTRERRAYVQGDTVFVESFEGQILSQHQDKRFLKAQIKDLRFSPNGNCLGVQYRSGRKRALAVFSLLNGKRTTYDCFARKGWDFHPRENALAVVAANGEISHVSLDAGQRTALFRSVGRAYGVRFNKTGSHLAVSSSPSGGSLIRIYDWVARKLQTEIPLGRAMCRDIAWHPSGQVLAAASEKRIGVWQLQPRTGKLKKGEPTLTSTLIRYLPGHSARVTGLDFSPRGDVLVSTSWDAVLSLWSPWTGRELVRARSENYDPVFSEDGRTIGVCGDKGQQQLIRRHGDDVMRIFRSRFDEADTLTGVEFNSDGTRLAIAGNDEVVVLSTNSLDAEKRFSQEGAKSAHFFDEDRVVFSYGSSGLRQFTLEESDPIPRFPFPELFIGGTFSDMSSDGRIALLSRTPLTRVFSLGENPDSATLDNSALLSEITMSDDGRFASAWNSLGVRLWNARTGALIRKVQSGPARSSFSKDNTKLLTVSSRECQLWDIESGERLWSYPRSNKSNVRGHGVFSADDSMLYVTDDIATVSLLDARDGSRLATINSETSRLIRHLALDPTQRYLAGITESSFTYVWDLAKIRDTLESMNLNWPTQTSGNP